MRDSIEIDRELFVSLLAGLVATCLIVCAAQAGNAGEAKFRRGIGISHVMMWAPLEPAPSKNFVFPPFTYSDAAFARELKALRRTGFDFVRFAVDPGPFLQWDGPRRDELTRKLVNYVRLILSHDLSVIVDFHPSDMHPDYLGARIAAAPDAPLFKDYLRLLARIATALNELQSSRIALELMNEPPPRARTWRPMLDAAYSTVRKAAPKLLAGARRRRGRQSRRDHHARRIPRRSEHPVFVSLLPAMAVHPSGNGRNGRAVPDRCALSGAGKADGREHRGDLRNDRSREDSPRQSCFRQRPRHATTSKAIARLRSTVPTLRATSTRWRAGRASIPCPRTVSSSVNLA